MAKTESSMLPLGTHAPEFCLPNVIDNTMICLNQAASKIATVVMFICNHCPYVKHVNPELVRLAQDYMPKGIAFLAINANDVENYPDDSPENMRLTAQQLGYPFPYLFDETQEVAQAFQAQCTPDFYIFDKNLVLAYRGQLDDSRPGNQRPLNGSSIRQALDHLIANQPVSSEQRPSLGCNIKWKSNN